MAHAVEVLDYCHGAFTGWETIRCPGRVMSSWL